VAEPELITTQLHALRSRLPEQLYDEVADGLLETYQAQLESHPRRADAARAAVTEFGDVDTITRAVCRNSSWHHLSSVLLSTGPVLGGVWAVTLLSGPTWLFSVPDSIRICYGAALLTAVALLLSGRLETRAYQKGLRQVLLASIVLVVLDLTMCFALLHSTVTIGGATAVALAASLARVAGVSTTSVRYLGTRARS
jgi:hypothetical protein